MKIKVNDAKVAVAMTHTVVYSPLGISEGVSEGTSDGVSEG